MSQCPHCQAEYEEGQRYCKICGSYLLHREAGDTFCPQCGIRVSQRQEFCHECDAPMQVEAAAATAPPQEQPSPAPAPTPGAPAKGAQPWLIGLLIGAGLIIAVLLFLLLNRPQTSMQPASPVPPQAGAPASPASPPAPSAAVPATPPAPQAPGLKEQLQAVLSNMREARLNKNIIQLMNCYSVTLADLEEKRRDTLKSWENYDYTNLVFTLDEVQPLDADNANAKVTWYVDIKNRRTGELISSTQTYQVRFAKELGQWRVRSVEEIE